MTVYTMLASSPASCLCSLEWRTHSPPPEHKHSGESILRQKHFNKKPCTLNHECEEKLERVIEEHLRFYRASAWQRCPESDTDTSFSNSFHPCHVLALCWNKSSQRWWQQRDAGLLTQKKILVKLQQGHPQRGYTGWVGEIGDFRTL